MTTDPAPPVTVYDALKWPAGVLAGLALWFVAGDFLLGVLALLLRDPLGFLATAGALAVAGTLATLVYFAPLVLLDRRINRRACPAS